MLMALPVYVVSAILMIPIIRDRAEGQLQPIALALLGFIYIGWMFGHLAFLANAKNAYGYLLFLLFAVPLNDVSAFTFGRLLGRTKFRPHISPNKTWAGAIGAFAVPMAFPGACGSPSPSSRPAN
jgi:phosphatidate cytidylyltransferase